ncbi:MAG: hypothetical protein HUU01_20195 [Saprospiraceae bacterium]|nr:hypothetical protein [Saprospiraceae bacterium]
MKKILLLAAVSWLSWQTLLACDVCGCSIGGQYLGILPQFNSHMAGLRYKYRSFVTNHPASLLENHGPERSEEYFHTAELWGRAKLGKRWQAFFFAPYHVFRQTGFGTKVSAIGDLQLVANYILLNTADSVGTLKQTLLVGGGIKAPAGRYQQLQDNEPLNPNLQAGTGSWDFQLNASYTLRYAKVGFNSEATLRLNTPNANDYCFGNRVSAAAKVFYWQQGRRTGWLPYAGMAVELAAHDHDAGERIPLTGGQLWLGEAGVDLYYQRFSIGVAVQVPVFQDLAGGLVDSGNRFSAQLSVFF